MHFRPRLGVNPIIVKDLRSRMRGVRAFAILTGALLWLGAVSYALYRIVLATTRYTSSPLSPQIGQTLFVAIAFLELMMVCFITPAVTAGAISGEKEKMTYEMLLATPLRPASILWGKLVSALSYVFLLVFAAVPMASLVFIFGGVSPRDMVKALVILLAVTVMLGVVGVFMSAWLGRTARATVLSYLVVLALLVGPVFVYILVGVLRGAEPPSWILVLNPVSALFSALSPSMSGDGPASVFLGLGMALGGNLRVITGSGSQAGIPRPLYHYTLPMYGAAALGLYLLAIRLVRPTRRWRIGWRESLAVLVLFLLFGGVVAVVFVSTANRYEKVSVLAAPTPVFVEKEVVQVVPALPAILPPPVAVSPLATPTPAALPVLSEDDQAAIFAAIVRQLCTVDHTLGESPDYRVVYLQPATEDAQVSQSVLPRAESHLLSKPVRTAVVAALTDLPLEFLWEDAPSVSADDDVFIAVVALGNIHLREDGSAVVSARLDIDLHTGMPWVYVLEPADSVWQVTQSIYAGQ